MNAGLARSSIVSLLLVAMVIGQATPQPAPLAPLGKEEFATRRMALAKAIVEKKPGQPAVVLVRGGAKQADMGSFVQDQDFLYLSGIAEPGIALLLVIGADGKLTRDEILVPPHNRFAATWDGQFLAPGAETAERTGFGTAAPCGGLAEILAEVLAAGADGKRPTLYTLTRPAARTGSTPGKASEAAGGLTKDPLDGRKSREEALVASIKQAHADVAVESVEQFLHTMRPHKSGGEIAVLTRCAQIAAEGIAEAMRSCEPGHYEYQLAAVARFVFTIQGAGPDAYAAIVGGGPNGCVLHYNTCQRQLLASDLIVMDYAPTLQGYATDVTRTFPASGKFTGEQRKLVQDVYEIQQELIADVKPGASLSAIGIKCQKLLKDRGYRSDHGPCHHVGLAVHDPSTDVLAAGMLITVEPGAYLRDKGMGCRIEDTILVTANGCDVLSKGVPSTPDAIEAMMAKPGVLPAPISPPR